MYYLDNAATTRPFPEVIDIVDKCLSQNFGNPSSIHPFGVQAANIISEARNTLAELFGVPQAGIIFCSSGTESDNLAINGIFPNKQHPTGNIITTSLEHAAVLKSVEALAEKGVAVDYVNINQQSGLVDLQHLKQLIKPDTRIVSIQHVNSETGIIQDLPSISKTIKGQNPDVFFHSDGVQGFSRFPVNLKKLGVDMYSISGHKFHGVKGAGALILSRRIDLRPIINGGGQEFGFRSGTENVAGIASLGLAAKLACKRINENYKKIEAFSRFLKQGIKNEIRDIDIFESAATVPHIISLAIPGIPGEILLHHLVERRIYVSTGSACQASSKKLSSVLQALGFSQKRIKETIRISLAAIEIPENQESFLKQFLEVVRELRDMM